MKEIYNWKEIENYVFEIITDKYLVYRLTLKPKEQHFINFCCECKDIYEIDLRCISGKPSYDEKIKPTIKAILNEVMSNRCDSLVYICDNSDDRAKCRETLFDKWFDEDDEICNDIEKFVTSRCIDEQATNCLNLYFIADKNCDNYEDNANDFLCEHCNSEEE